MTWRRAFRMRLILTAITVSIVLVSSTVVHADDASRDWCSDHFRQIRAVAQKGALAKAASSGESEALLRELRIERALWADRVEHHRERLEAAGADAALNRLDQLDLDVQDRLDLLEGVVRGARQESPEVLRQLLECGPSSPRGPLSAAAAPVPSITVERRRPEPTGQARPQGYPAPPTPEMRPPARESMLKAAIEAREPEVIAATVAAVGADPVALYNHVVNEVRPALYVGSAKGPAATLRSGEGNDFDQALLLAALMREAGYPARVVWGLQEVPLAALLHQFGAEDAAELEQMMTAVGVAWDPVLVGGRPGAYLIQRAWCEVWMAFSNFRGVVLDTVGPGWHPLDPSISAPSPVSVDSILDGMGFDATVFVAGYLAGDHCTEPLTEPLACPAPREILRSQIGAFLQTQGLTYETAVAGSSPAPRDDDLLPTAMVGTVTEVHGFGIDYPDGLRHQVRMIAREGQRVLLDVELPVADLAGREATIWFVPATPEDHAVVAAFGREPWQAPPYLLDVAVQIRADDAEVALGGEEIGMGRPFELEVILTAPGGDQVRFVNAMMAGTPVGLGISPGAQGYDVGRPQPVKTAEILADLADGWMRDTAAFEGELAALEGERVLHPFPSLVSVGSVVRPSGALGVVEQVDWLGVYVDVDLHGSRLTGDPDRARRWLELIQLDGSAREREVFEQLGVTSVSADKVLMMADQNGVPIHHIHQGNLASMLVSLPFSGDVLDEIERWVNLGGEAWIPANELSLIEWTGVGYRLYEPVTGESRYQLSGGLSGGMSTIPVDGFPSVLTPLSVPSLSDVNADPNAAATVEILDGNLQVGVVGETFGVTPETTAPRVVVFDAQGNPVANASVEVSVVAGGGGVGPSGAQVYVTTTNPFGYAQLQVTAGTETAANPIYLVDPEETYPTRCGMNVYSVRVFNSGFVLQEPLVLLGRPGDLATIHPIPFQSFIAAPHLTVGPLQVGPKDAYGNPISNHEVTYELVGSGPGPDQYHGPWIMAREDVDACGSAGVVPPGACPGIRRSVLTTTGGVSGVGPYAMVGTEDTTIRATAHDASGTAYTADFSVRSKAYLIPGIEKILTVRRRGQPVNANGEIIEAYRPGATGAPLTVSLWITRQEVELERCDPGAPGEHWCAVMTGRYHTVPLDHDAVTMHDACGVFALDDACDTEIVPESGSVEFILDGVSSVVSEQNERNEYVFTPTLPATPGRYEVAVIPSVIIRSLRLVHPSDYSIEVVGCPGYQNPPCGAELIPPPEPISDPGWSTSYTLWAVEPTWPDPGASPPPLVRLGHGQRTEEQHDFAYGLEPAGYVPLDTNLVFTEDGLIRHATAGELGQASGTASLSSDARFEHPEGIHEAYVHVNAAYFFNVGDIRVPMDIQSDPLEFPILMLDADVDSDNDNPWMEALDRDDEEDALERIDELASNPRGKIIFTNTDDSDNDGIPDYADLKTGPDQITSYGEYGETAMVPMDVELRGTAAVVGATEVVFNYEGPEPGDFPLDPGTVTHLGAKGMHDYYDYTDRRRGRLRVWRGVADPGDQRTADDLVLSGLSYTAAELGFTPTNPVVRFWVEAVNGNTPSGAVTADVVSVEASVGAHPLQADEVVLVPFDVNLGINNSNDEPDRLRVGVPDTDWVVDDFDDLVEDQGDGFRAWRRATDQYKTNEGLSAIDDVRASENVDSPEDVTLYGLVDFFPLEVWANTYLHGSASSFDNGVEFMLAWFNSPDTEGTIYETPQVLGDPTGLGRAVHLSDLANGQAFEAAAETGLVTLDGFVSQASGPYTVGRGNRLEFLDTGEAKNHMVLRFLPVDLLPADADNEQCVLRLMAKPRKMGGSHLSDPGWVVVDSVRMTIKEVSQWYSLWSSRGDGDEYTNATRLLTYPLDNGTTVPSYAYPEAAHSNDLSGELGAVRTSGLPEPDVEKYFVWTHGYNVPYDAFYFDWCKSGYKRLFWTGWRGNTVFYTWKGDMPEKPWDEDSDNSSLFGFANQQALRSSRSFKEFIEDTVRGDWGADVEDVTVLAHSLGNVVVWDALRIHAAETSNLGSDYLFDVYIAAEAAVPGETLWPYGPVTYCGGSPDDPDDWFPDCLCTGINPDDPDDNTDCTYSVEELECNSWAWWFNQPGQEAWKAARRVVHSYSPSDGVVSNLMRLQEYMLRQIPTDVQEDGTFPMVWDDDACPTVRDFDTYLDIHYHRKPELLCADGQRRVPDPWVVGPHLDAPNLAAATCDTPGAPFLFKLDSRTPRDDRAEVASAATLYNPTKLVKGWWLFRVANNIAKIVDFADGFLDLEEPLGVRELPRDAGGVPVLNNGVNLDATLVGWPDAVPLDGLLSNHSSLRNTPYGIIGPWYRELAIRGGFEIGRDHD
jgi:hypothetical protein